MSFDTLTWLDCCTIVLSIYVIYECFTAVCSMSSGFRLFCHKLKFILGFSSACVLIYYAILNTSKDIQWLIFGVAGTFASFVWPRMIWRIKNALQQLEICLNETHD